MIVSGKCEHPLYDSPGKGSENVTFALRPEWELTIQALQEESARRGQSLKALREEHKEYQCL